MTEMHIPGLLNDHIALQLPDGAILDDVAVLYTFIDGDDIKVALAPSEGTDTVESLQLAVNFVINLQAAGYLTEEDFLIEEVPTDEDSIHDAFPTPNQERYPYKPEITE